MSNAKPPVFNVGIQPHVFKSARTLSPTAELSPAAKEMLEKAHRAPQVAHRSSRMRRELVTFLVALAERDPAAPVALAERPGDALNLAQDLMRFGLVAGLHSRGRLPAKFAGPRKILLA